MSFDKHKDFQAEVVKAEQDFHALYPKDEVKPTEAVPPTPTEPTDPAAVVTPQVTPVATSEEDEKYKAAVKAMNEAQRKAAEAAKREEEFLKRETELKEKLEQAQEAARLAMERVPPKVEAQEEHDDLEDDLPEVARIAERKAKKAMSPLEKRIADIEARQEAERVNRERLSQDAVAMKMLEEIKVVHPDYDQLVNSEEMTAWINNEAPPIYKSIFDGTIPFQTKDAIAVLNAYKSTTTPKQASAPATPSAAEVAAPVRTNPNIAPKLTPDRELTAKDYDYFMHNSHRMKPEELAEWDRRLNS